MKPSSEELNPNPAIYCKFIAVIALVLFATAGMIAAAYINNRGQADRVGWIEHSHSLISETEAIVHELQSAEAASRMFLLAGDQASKQLAEDAFTKVTEKIEIARELAFQSPEHLQRLIRLDNLVKRQVEFNKEAIQLRIRGIPAALSVITNSEAGGNFAAIEKELHEAKAEQYALLTKSEKRLQWQTWLTAGGLVLGFGVNAALLIYGFTMVRKDVAVLRKRGKALEKTNEELEKYLSARTGELTATANKLQIEQLEQQWGEAALNRLAGHHQLVVDSLRDSVLVISRNGKILSSNPAAADLAEREEKQLPGHSIVEFVVENKTSGNTPWDRHFLSNPIRTGETLPPTAAFLKKPNGTTLPVRVACYPTRDSNKLTGAVVTMWAGV